MFQRFIKSALLKKWVWLWISIAATFVALTVLGIYVLAHWRLKKKVAIYIYPETTFMQVLDTLHRCGAVQHPSGFQWLATLLSYHQNLRLGYYELPEGITYWRAIRILRAGKQTPVRITFRSFRGMERLAQFLEKHLLFSKEDFLKAVYDTTFLHEIKLDSHKVLGIFLPDTYEFYWSVSPKKFVRRIYYYYRRFWEHNNREERAKAIGLTPIEVVILASIVQEETRYRDEYRRIAGVYINRLKKGMPLQADPTVRFALQDFKRQRVLLRDLFIDSPYNTYRYKGLPPGPINNPEKQVIDAVLNYEKHDYLYFCARDDFSGYHYFSRTYKEHLRYARRFQNALNKRRIFR